MIDAVRLAGAALVITLYLNTKAEAAAPFPELIAEMKRKIMTENVLKETII